MTEQERINSLVLEIVEYFENNQNDDAVELAREYCHRILKAVDADGLNGCRLCQS